jgi:hypothetical protein
MGKRRHCQPGKDEGVVQTQPHQRRLSQPPKIVQPDPGGEMGSGIVS